MLLADGCLPAGVVGKSSFMNKVSRANVDVQPYAFTTKSLVSPSLLLPLRFTGTDVLIGISYA